MYVDAELHKATRHQCGLAISLPGYYKAAYSRPEVTNMLSGCPCSNLQREFTFLPIVVLDDFSRRFFRFLIHFVIGHFCQALVGYYATHSPAASSFRTISFD